MTAPLAYQGRAGLQHDTGIEGRAALLERSGQGLQALPQHAAGPAISLLLQLIGEGSDQQIATEARRRSGVVKLMRARSTPKGTGSLRDLHAQILRRGARAGIQFAAGAARGLRGVH